MHLQSAGFRRLRHHSVYTVSEHDYKHNIDSTFVAVAAAAAAVAAGVLVPMQ